jgi:hypothetical protein
MSSGGLILSWTRQAREHWTIGGALEVLADDSSFDELAELARDRRYGMARQMIVLGLGRSKRPEAVEVLVGLVDDPEVEGQPVKALAG